MSKEVVSSQDQMLAEMQAMSIRFMSLAAGQNTGVVIGAALNVIMTVSQVLPRGPLQAGVATRLRDIADQLDAIGSGVQQ